VSAPGEVLDLAGRLMALVEEITEGAVRPGREEASTGSIRRLGLNSISMLNFLVAVEDEFGIEWDDDLDAGVLESFEAMAGYIARERA
jgi:acyl carrier protein